ncbi:MAG TPA: DUF1801 domain-containing protein [Hyphomonadaceae bacterium]|nr:DUF1801 domain-containing protein [Hyphomonadaceae bacterium]
MAETKTKPTAVSVKAFIAAVTNDTRRADAQTLLKLFEKVSGVKAKMWGPSIIGFGKYTYTYDSGHSGDAPVLGFSPRAANIVIYGGSYPEQIGPLLKKLGKHKSSKACIYINKLADVDMAVLETLLKDGLAEMRKTAKEKGWPLVMS